jgi:phosphoribosylaminoimidazolecarboxamide formyltransferase/IMP cyclohydrolase
VAAPIVKRALISVTDKSGVVALARGLARLGVEVVSTGGTARALEEAGVEVVPLERFTGSPEMLDGRVKTLHPRVHAGILARRDLDAHAEEMAAHGLAYIDLVAVNLYDFHGARSRAAGPEDVVEAIDIGGPTLLRAAAKNHAGVLPVVRPADYPRVLSAIEQGAVDEALRRELAAAVFAHTARYDAAVAGWLEGLAAPGEAAPTIVTRSLEKVQDLRYGENAHQSAAFYRNPGAPEGLARAEVLQGKALSYNNLLDLDAALAISVDVAALRDAPNAVFIKHNNPCGVALDDALPEAVRRARACDAVSAFGAVVAVSRPLDGAAAEALTEAFVEAVIAPGYSDEALATLATKKNLRVLRLEAPWVPPASAPVWREVRGGVLRQDQDVRSDPSTEVEGARVVTTKAPTVAEQRALGFAWVVAKHVKSNAIVFAHEDRLVAVGAGQMSRVDAVKLCELKAGAALRGAVVASDAFFPFRDGVDVLAGAGARAIVQPGGSIRDDEVVSAANEHGLAMLFTGVRHFRH